MKTKGKRIEKTRPPKRHQASLVRQMERSIRGAQLHGHRVRRHGIASSWYLHLLFTNYYFFNRKKMIINSLIDDEKVKTNLEKN